MGTRVVMLVTRSDPREISSTPLEQPGGQSGTVVTLPAFAQHCSRKSPEASSTDTLAGEVLRARSEHGRVASGTVPIDRFRRLCGRPVEMTDWVGEPVHKIDDQDVPSGSAKTDQATKTEAGNDAHLAHLLVDAPDPS